MPSFFRSDVDVKIVYDKKRVLTPDEKKQKKRLMIPFDQSVRRAGTKGNFFFHRKNSCVGGPILILEPQGPVDRGIFQGGISKFGETLSGKFECTKPGFIVLYTKKNVSEANKLKFGRAIRKAIKKATGMMTSGGEDRITIITPKDKERAAKEAAAEKKRLAEEARQRQVEERARRKLKREERSRLKAEKRAQKAQARASAQAEPRAAAKPKARPKPKPKARTRTRPARTSRQTPAPPKPKVTPQQVEERWEAADTSQEGWLESEAKAGDLASAAIAISARAEASRDQAEESYSTLQQSTQHLHALREGIKKAGGRAKVDLQQEIAREEARQRSLEAAFEELNARAVALETEATQQAQALEAAREEAMVLQLEAAKARLVAAKAEQEAAEDDAESGEDDVERELDDAARQLALAQAELGIDQALKQISVALAGVDHEADGAEFKSTRVYLGALIWENKSLRKGVEKLRVSSQLIESSTDRVRILATHWAHHADIEWAESAVDMLIES